MCWGERGGGRRVREHPKGQECHHQTLCPTAILRYLSRSGASICGNSPHWFPPISVETVGERQEGPVAITLPPQSLPPTLTPNTLDGTISSGSSLVSHWKQVAQPCTHHCDWVIAKSTLGCEEPCTERDGRVIFRFSVTVSPHTQKQRQ